MAEKQVPNGAAAAPPTLEERLAKLEAEVAALKQQLGGSAPAGTWVDRISGGMKDIPEDAWQEFQEACRRVKEEGRLADD
jgi:hypothetical protein